MHHKELITILLVNKKTYGINNNTVLYILIKNHTKKPRGFNLPY
jgi:hypothetical protein